ncbi:MAG: hypothetical protein KF824_08530 [Fimbriimonadaceae bacterium]|nr:MAG: hypothetical protein KF824_08530 [Fimbriimonadaceae bacterium]
MKHVVYLLPIGLTLFLSGCYSSHKLMPLEQGSVWTYQCNPGLVSRVEQFEITSTVPVGKASGIALTSRLGTTTLAWQGNHLVAGKLAGSEFFPPIPLFAPLSSNGSLDWKGKIRTAGVITSASASLKSIQTEEKIGTRTVQATETTLTLQDGKNSHELLTWFSAGLGIVRQEHRINGSLVNRLRYISGP